MRVNFTQSFRFSLCHLGRNPYTDFALIGPVVPPEFPYSLEMHWYWPETHLCFPRMMLAQQTFVHECSTVFCSLP